MPVVRPAGGFLGRIVDIFQNLCCVWGGLVKIITLVHDNWCRSQTGGHLIFRGACLEAQCSGYDLGAAFIVPTLLRGSVLYVWYDGERWSDRGLRSHAQSMGTIKNPSMGV